MNVLHAPSSEPPDRTDQSFCIAKRCGAVGWTTTEIGHSSAHARVREDDARVQRLLSDPVPGSMTPRRRPATRSNAQAGSTSACGRYGSITMCGGWAEASRICARAARRDHVHVELANRGDGDARTGLSSLNTAPRVTYTVRPPAPRAATWSVTSGQRWSRIRDQRLLAATRRSRSPRLGWVRIVPSATTEHAFANFDVCRACSPACSSTMQRRRARPRARLYTRSRAARANAR